MADKPTYEELEQRVKELEDEVKRNETKEALRESEEKYQNLYNNAPDMYFTVSPDGVVKSVNQFGADYLGFSKEELIGGPVWDIVYKDDLELVQKQIAEIFSQKLQKRELEFRKIRKDGSILWVHERTNLVLDENDNPIELWIICRDVSDRKKTEEVLRESEEKMRTILNSMPDVVLQLDTNLKILWANKTTLMMKPDAIGQLCYKALPGTNDTCPNCPVVKALKTGKIERGIVYLQSVAGVGESYWDDVGVPIKDAQGKIISIVKLARNITDSKQAEEALRESEEKYRDIFENVSDFIYIHDLEGYFIETNLAAKKDSGYSEDDLANMNIKDLISEQYKHQFENYLMEIIEKRESEGLLRVVAKDGSEHILEYRNSLIYDKTGPIGVRGSARDITEQRKLESQLRQAQKMEAIGTLAGGIAHDFNNILFPIIGYTEMAMDDVPEDSRTRKNLNEILKGALRARDLVQQILTFSRQHEKELKPLKVQLVAREALKLIRSSLPTTIEISQDIDKDCGLVMADPTQVHQIVMNLCTNAYHAMDETGGTLEVDLTEVELTVDDLTDLGMEPGPYLCLKVGDTGHGMDQSVMDRIFDPYFTTKEKGRGTGLGLAVVHVIVKSYGGGIRIYSEPGKGTVFHVYLPLIKEAHVSSETISDKALLTGHERILLVDDEEVIVSMEKQILERLGYHVTARTGSIDALEAFREQPDKFDLVITDMTMPNMTGDKLAGELKNIRPEIPVILCTGFSEKISREKADALGIKGFLMKPIVMKDLAKNIRKVLDE